MERRLGSARAAAACRCYFSFALEQVAPRIILLGESRGGNYSYVMI